MKIDGNIGVINMIKGFINLMDDNYFFYLDHDELTLTSINQEKSNYIDIFLKL